MFSVVAEPYTLLSAEEPMGKVTSLDNPLLSLKNLECLEK